MLVQALTSGWFWRPSAPVTPDLSVPTTMLASAASLPTLTNLATTMGVNVRYLAIISVVMSLADMKVVGNMVSSTGEIVTQSRGLYLGNVIMNVLCLGPPQEESYILLESPVILPIFSQSGLDFVVIHM